MTSRITGHLEDRHMPTPHRPIAEIACEIARIWTKPYFGALPYIRAMQSLVTIHDACGHDDAKTIILYFLANAKTWRGEDARRIKAELKAIPGVK